MWYRTKLAQFGGGAVKQNADSTTLSPNMGVFKPETLNVYKPEELIIQGTTADSPLMSSLKTLGVDADYMYPELMELINSLQLNADEIAQDSNKLQALFDILVNRTHSNIPKDDDHSAGFEAMEARRHSPFHTNPEETPLEVKLRATQHQSTNVPTTHDIQKTQGYMAIHGMPQYAKGKQSPLLMNTELPSSRTLY